MPTDNPVLIGSAQERDILSLAYVPEHIPGLMTNVSQAKPILFDDYLGYVKDNWIIFIGYPLKSQFDKTHCGELIAQIIEKQHPEYLWFIGPEIPLSLSKSIRARQSDKYLRLDLDTMVVRSSLKRELNQAAKKLTVEHVKQFTSEHENLVNELMRRAELPPMVAELYRSMPEYVARSSSVLVLNARSHQNRLTAFLVVECAAEKFDTYVLGCHSKKNYVSHASDLLFYEMIQQTRKRDKSEINLGLGVNEGISRFKIKWGGVPYLNYEFCECYFGLPEQLSALDLLSGNLL